MENILNEEFFYEKSSEMNHVYFVYSILAGVFYEEYLTPKFKRLALCFAMIAHVICTTGTSMVALEPGIDFPTKQITSTTFIITYIWITIVLIVYWKRDSYRELFELMNEDLNHSLVHDRTAQTNGIEPKSMRNFNIKVGTYFVVWIAMIYAGKLVQKYITYEGEFRVDNKFDFLFPIPFGIFQSVFGFVLIYHITFAFFLFYVGIMYGSQVLPTMLSIHLENQTIRLRNDIRYHSDINFQCLEECFRREEEILMDLEKSGINRQFELRALKVRSERQIEEFMLKVEQWIGIHQRWISCANLLKKCTTEILSLHVAFYITAITGSGYFLTKMVLDSQETGYQYIFYIICDTIFLLMACSVGNSTGAESEALLMAIYSTPWYYLPAKHQKTLLNFLCLAQENPEIRIFNVFPLSLEKFPKMMNDAYGYIQLMRVLEMKNT